MELALLGAIGAMLCWGIGDFFIQRKHEEDRRHRGARVGSASSAAVMLLPFVIGDLRSLTAAQDIALLTALGAITFVVAVCNFEALKEGKISVVDTVLTLELPLTVMLGMLFFSERISFWQLATIVVLMWGVGLISVHEKAMRFKIEKGVWLAVCTAIGMALDEFLTAAASIRVSPLMAIWFPWLLFNARVLPVMSKRPSRRDAREHARAHRLDMGVFDMTAKHTSVRAATGTNRHERRDPDRRRGREEIHERHADAVHTASHTPFSIEAHRLLVTEMSRRPT